MVTIERTVEIPADRRLVLDLPQNVPDGRTIEELKAEAARKAAEQQAAIDATGIDPVQKFCGALQGFFGEDVVAYQRTLRDEWPD